MTAEELVKELSQLKVILVMHEGIDINRFNRLYDLAINAMLSNETNIKELIEEFFYFRTLVD